MTRFLENVIEKLIGDGIITETELQQKIEEEKKRSLTIKDKELLATLTVTTLENDDAVANMLGVLFMSVDELSNLVVAQAIEIEQLKLQLGGNE